MEHRPTERSDRAVRIGSRGSKLALAQARRVGEALAAAHPGLAWSLVEIGTKGDRLGSKAIPEIGGKGLFTLAIGRALLAGSIDLAVHSLKDLPTETHPRLAVRAVPERAPANDALLSATGAGLAELPRGARVGTSSPRRAAQLRHVRPDLRPVPIRGNLDTRIRKLREGGYEAIVVALAGLVRLGLAGTESEVLSLEAMVPAPGQGALAVEARAEDRRAARLAAAVDHGPTAAATAAERHLLQALGGGCSLPLGAYASVAGEALRLRAVVLAPDGSAACTAERSGPVSEPASVAREVAHELRRAGGEALLARQAEGGAGS
ncbi:MAG: hydroxymethylbilane synthase [Candidatus Brocadiia bacterium]